MGTERARVVVLWRQFVGYGTELGIRRKLVGFVFLRWSAQQRREWVHVVRQQWRCIVLVVWLQRTREERGV
jgi:hypothetical protein